MSNYCRVESFTFLSTGVTFGTIGWLVLIDNRWTLIDGPRDTPGIAAPLSSTVSSASDDIILVPSRLI